MEHPATPKHIALKLTTVHGLAANRGQRNELEHQYYRFHYAHGTRLRGKYRPR